MGIILPDDVRYIIERLTEYGYEAYAVGGCVRDSILCRKPGDWDITTSALPMQVKELFKRTVDTGIRHGTVTVMLGRNGYEVTTYRIDGAYNDSRHPDTVTYTQSLVEDLKRRDFTINAMAYNEKTGLVDCFDGVGDIERKLIRCVGDPLKRFGEDALRMLRAVRFAAQLGFSIHPDTGDAVRALAPDIAKISRERIHSELGKILLSDHPDYFFMAKELGMTKYFMPVPDDADYEGTAMRLLNVLPKQLPYRYAAILYTLSAEDAEKVLKDLKLDNDTIKMCVGLLRYHGIEPSDNPVRIRQDASRIGPDFFEKVLTYEEAFYSARGDNEAASAILKEREEYRIIRERGDCLSIGELKIKGADLITLGVLPGREMGDMLERCLQAVLCDPEINDKDKLIETIHIKD